MKMFRPFLCKMSNPIRRLRLDNPNVLPFCYELALNNNSPNPQRTFTSTTTQTNDSNVKPNSQSVEENPYFAKYADKIKKAQAANTKSLSFSEDLQKTMNAQSEVANEGPITNKINIETSLEEKDNLKGERKTESKSSAPLRKSRQSLDDIVKLNLLQEKSSDEIIQIWNAYHSKKDCIFASIPVESYNMFYKNSSNYPAFILPLPRNADQSSGGYEFFLLQFEEHSCFFTPLAAYHLHKESAPVCLSLFHYPELSQSKGIILMMGEFDSNILNIMECQCLANQLQYYYTTKEAAPQLSLHLFNKEPKSFDHTRLIRHLEEGILSNGLGAVNLNKQD